ncbi:DUF3872 domain-containing protein [Chryseobacterium balustinum]|uniref:DUF based on B. Theta Gene description n=1 Tax=Chryseobacterium balustinum TaxID=246 RepID=A0AAX2ILK3_9FLAO|nr:DUF3872 domain-containing protein [Chryseobacterium balustinum]AZB29771.1 DUF3872 domain-containing protein [Chryseobacterium balustinum]SKC14612.1 protein of unknown function [Chryseobacterium balustinum]SQA90140.1 DUF based on B. Theta Gene description [Chryseobacterium balustinum]
MKYIKIIIKKGLALLLIIPVMILFVLSLSSCSTNDLEIQQNFPFELHIMPIPKDVANGEIVEIRLKIIPKGNFTETKYYIRYFQFDGTGTLCYNNEPPYKPNDSYELSEKEFRLYYTSTSTVSQSFDVWIYDSFGNGRQISFQFNTKD